MPQDIFGRDLKMLYADILLMGTQGKQRITDCSCALCWQDEHCCVCGQPICMVGPRELVIRPDLDRAYCQAHDQAEVRGFWDTRGVTINGHRLSIVRSFKLRRPSLDDFSWGYSGSAPAQLALALLLEWTTEATALALYQYFKHDVIARLSLDEDFTLPGTTITAWLLAHMPKEDTRDART